MKKTALKIAALAICLSVGMGIAVESLADELEDFSTLDLSVSRKFFNHVELSLNVENIFDKKYESVYGYATEGQSVYGKIKYSF